MRLLTAGSLVRVQQGEPKKPLSSGFFQCNLPLRVSEIACGGEIRFADEMRYDAWVDFIQNSILTLCMPMPVFIITTEPSPSPKPEYKS